MGLSYFNTMWKITYLNTVDSFTFCGLIKIVIFYGFLKKFTYKPKENIFCNAPIPLKFKEILTSRYTTKYNDFTVIKIWVK